MDFVFDRHPTTVTLSNGDLTASSTSSWYVGAQSVISSKDLGKWYYEVVPVGGALSKYMGVSNENTLTTDSQGIPGVNVDGFSFRGNGDRFVLAFGSFQFAGFTFSDGDILGFILDLDNSKIWISVNGVVQGGGDPVAGTTPYVSGFSGGCRPSMGMASGTSVTLRMLEADLSYTPPEGFNTIDYIAGYPEVISYPVKKINYTISEDEAYSAQEGFPVVINLKNGSGKTDFDASPVFRELSGGNDSYTKLLIHADEVDGSTDLIDSSDSEHVITANGNAAVKDFNADGNEIVNHSMYMPGSSSYFYPSTQANFTYGTEDFCVEFMLFPVDSTFAILYDGRTTSNGNWLQIRYEATRDIQIVVSGVVGATSVDTLVLNEWQHIAVVKYSGTIYVYIEGIEEMSVANATSILGNANRPAIGAAGYTAGSSPFTGYMAGIAIHKGVPVYTAAFTPPSKLSEMTKTLDTVLFLDLLDVTHGETPATFTDSSFYEDTVTNNSSAISCCTFWWSGAVEFDGTGDYLTVPQHTDFQFGSDSFTIDMYVLLKNIVTTDYTYICGDWEFSGLSDEGWVLYKNVTTNKFTFYAFNSVGTPIGPLTSDLPIVAGKYYHISVVRNGTSLVLYVDGVAQIIDATSSLIISVTTNPIVLGGIWNSGATDVQDDATTSPLDGFIAEPRISKGIARHTAAFIPPTKQYRGSWERIHITDASNNELYCEVESWDLENEKATIHVKVPTISSSADTVLILDYNELNDFNPNISASEEIITNEEDVSPHDLTSHTSHSPYVVSANHEYSTSYEAWMAFNNDTATFWATSTGWPCWLEIDFNELLSKPVTKYSVQVNTIPQTIRAPKDWLFQGSINGSDWDTLHTVTGSVSWGDEETRTFNCTVVSTAYRYYRLYITNANGDASWTQVAGLFIYTGDAPPHYNVWDENFVFVSHQAQDPSGTAPQIQDSTSYGKHGTSYGTMLTADLIDGDVGKALDYDGTDDYTNHGYDAAHDITDTLTLEVSFTPNTLLDSGLTDHVGILERQNIPTGAEDTYALMINSDGELQLTTNGGNTQSTKNTWGSDTNFIVASTYNSTGLAGDLFVDGVKETLTSDVLDTMAGSSNDLIIGLYSTTRFFPGAIGEVRISNIVRSDDWLALTNLSLTDQLFTVTEWQPAPPVDKLLPGYIDFPKPYNTNFMNDFRPNSLIRIVRKGFFTAF